MMQQVNQLAAPLKIIRLGKFVRLSENSNSFVRIENSDGVVHRSVNSQN